MESIRSIVTDQLLVDWLQNQGLDILVALIVVITMFYIVGFVLDRAIRQLVKSTGYHRGLHRKDIEKRQQTLSELFRNIWRVALIIGFAVRVLYILVPSAGEVLAPLFASAGIIGVALGFGAQSLIKDFISGIFIIAENQYRVGDVIDIEGFSGTVERIGSRSTVIRDADGSVHYFPNGMVQHVVNKTMGYSMARFSLLLHPSVDIEHVVQIINDTGATLASEKKWENKIIEPPSFISIGDFSGNSVEIAIGGKTQPSDQWAVTSEMRLRLLEALEREKIRLARVPRSNRI